MWDTGRSEGVRADLRRGEPAEGSGSTGRDTNERYGAQDTSTRKGTNDHGGKDEDYEPTWTVLEARRRGQGVQVRVEDYTLAYSDMLATGKTSDTVLTRNAKVSQRHATITARKSHGECTPESVIDRIDGGGASEYDYAQRELEERHSHAKVVEEECK